MKLKYLIMVLIVVAVLLAYNMFCYWFVNKTIDKGTKNIITGYFNKTCNNCEYEYEYLRSTINDDNTINVFIKVDGESLGEYYRFIVVKSDSGYQFINVNNDIPAYIK